MKPPASEVGSETKHLLFNKFYHGMLEQGVYLAPASYEAGFVSKAHDKDIIAKTLEAADKVFAMLK